MVLFAALALINNRDPFLIPSSTGGAVLWGLQSYDEGRHFYDDYLPPLITEVMFVTQTIIHEVITAILYINELKD